MEKNFIGVKIDQTEEPINFKGNGHEETSNLTDLSPWECSVDALLRDLSGAY